MSRAGENVCFRLRDGSVRNFCRLRHPIENEDGSLSAGEVMAELPETFEMGPTDACTPTGIDAMGGQRITKFKLTDQWFEGHRIYDEVVEDEDDGQDPRPWNGKIGGPKPGERDCRRGGW